MPGGPIGGPPRPIGGIPGGIPLWSFLRVKKSYPSFQLVVPSYLVAVHRLAYVVDHQDVFEVVPRPDPYCQVS
ncbi:hypothetical protein ALC57_09536 [Trachymyrmex cornetzi]|uniref:Uncharacterized protein n=1 Tax=Trachymyrmex cornetzi TaxID=471704 RepID=A0A195DZE1_9HYME|nr:hypothetical protein ALC57_09536 [Trachymyrmex cornetzi]